MSNNVIKNEDIVSMSVCYVYRFSPVDLYPHAITFQELGWDHKLLAACIDELFSDLVSNESGKYQDGATTHYGFTVCPGVRESQMWAARKLCSKGTTVLITTNPFLDGNKMDSIFETVGSFAFVKLSDTAAAWHRVQWSEDTRAFELVQPEGDCLNQGVENKNREEDR